jgi:8-amino-7-oxononanoate synthase
MSDLAAAAAAELAALEVAGRLRRRPLIDSPDGRVVQLRDQGGRRTLVNWASNDYLGASGALTVRNGAARALRSFGAGSGAARLLAGGLAIHHRLEQALARWLGCEAVLLATTGFQANLAAVTSLVGDGDAVVLDRLCHASLYDGARLSGARLHRFLHNDPADLARVLAGCAGARRRLVCVESVYSMDGDEAPLAQIAAVCRAHDAVLLVDEAHALGVLGPGGRGLCAELGVRPDVLVATCSKSLGAQGGITAAAAPVVELVVNRGRPFIYSTAPVPAAAGAACAALDLLRRDPGLPAALLARAAGLRQGLAAQGWSVPAGRTPIVPVLVGGEAETLALAARLRELGHYAPAIRPPTVPEGSCRLRLTVTLAHRDADVRRLLTVMAGLRPAPVGA